MISEGLTQHALQDLIKPVISIDEFESKISDQKVIVVGVYITEKAPGEDLIGFIDRSDLPVLDTEVSPSPTPDGDYVAFIELRRDENFPKTLMDLIAQINNLTNVEQWQYITPSQSNPVDLDEKSLQFTSLFFFNTQI